MPKHFARERPSERPWVFFIIDIYEECITSYLAALQLSTTSIQRLRLNRRTFQNYYPDGTETTHKHNQNHIWQRKRKAVGKLLEKRAGQKRAAKVSPAADGNLAGCALLGAAATSAGGLPSGAFVWASLFSDAATQSRQPVPMRPPTT